MTNDDILPVLYDLSVTIGGETKLKTLLTRTLQRLLYHTSYACGFICLDIDPAGADSEPVLARLDAAVGDFEMLRLVGKPIALPRSLILGKAAQEKEQTALLKQLNFTRTPYEAFLRLPIEKIGVIVLLSPKEPETNLPLTKAFQPVLAHLAKAIKLCRVNEAYAAELLHHSALLSKIFDSSFSGIAIADAGGLILETNSAFSKLMKYTKDDLSGARIQDFLNGAGDDGFGDEVWDSLKKEKHWEGEAQIYCKDGGIFQSWLLVNPILDERGNVTNYAFMFSDIGKQKEAEMRIHQLAYFDMLTGLPNRHLLSDKLDRAIALSARTNKHGAVLFIDLDNFKTINDIRGYTVGDLLLVEVARRLQSCLSEGDTVSRQGGDEFVAILQNLGDTASGAEARAEQIAEKIHQALYEKKYSLDGYESRTTASIGITLFHGNGEPVDILLKHADMAMYQAKKAGRNTIRFFNPELQSRLEERQRLMEDLKLAIEKNELLPYYQKQVSSGNVVGAEILLRWKHPERGLVSPGVFIPLAEETGFIVSIGTWVLKQACLRLKAWGATPGMEDLTLAVNVSAKQFRMPDFVEQVRAILEETDVSPANLKLELTESIVLEDAKDAIQKMNELNRYGIKLSMDDFGTGYSSLQYLKLLPLRQIKIDQGFVRDMINNTNDAVIVQTIIAMAKSMDLEVIAEGVETQAQYDFLKVCGCRNYQGYLFGKPVPIEQFDTSADYAHEPARRDASRPGA
jgi:diguanylate cyclase (GGDEF)-like protein/PAS domain S-box-containing protein